MWLLIVVDVYAALADPVRRAVLARLAGGPARVVDLAAGHDISRPAVSKHLRLLSEAGLVVAEPRGRERHYRLLAGPLAEVQTFLRELTGPRTRFAETDLDALALEVRRTVRERQHQSGERHTGNEPSNQKETG